MYVLVAAMVATVAAALVHAAATRKVRRLQAVPDRYSLDRLSRDPEGEEVILVRPDGTRIRAIARGEGVPVVFSHGYGGSLAEWNVLFDLFVAAGFRAIAFDHRGFGRSTVGSDGVGSGVMAGDVRAVLEHFDVRDGVLVGHSMGGFLAVVFAVEHAQVARERLRGLVLVGAVAGDAYAGSPQNRLQIPLIRYGVLQRVFRSPIYGSLTALTLIGDEPSPAIVEAARRMVAAHDPRPVVPISRAVAAESWYGRLGEIPVPAVVVCGEKDRTAPPWHSRRLGAEIRGARNVWLPGKGHLLPWEAPEVLVDAIRSFHA